MMKLLPGICGLMLALTTTAAELRQVSENVISSMPWFHRNGQGLVAEMVDSSTIMSESQPRGDFSLLLTSRGRDAVVNLEFKLCLQQSADGISLLRKSGIKLSADRTLVSSFLLELDSEAITKLQRRKSVYNLIPLTVKVVVTNADNAVITALVDTAAFSFARRNSVTFPRSAIVDNHGTPTLQINDRFHPGIFGYVGWNWLPARQTIAALASQDMHLYEINFQPWSLWKNGNIDAATFERKINQQVNAIVANDPDALIFLRWWLYMPREWSKQYPAERITYDDGSHDSAAGSNKWEHASYASPVWRQQYSAVIGEAIRRLARSPYADRIFMVRVGYGNAGEWNNFGYQQGKFPGFSEPMRQRFISWLQSRYPTLTELNRAWQTKLNDWNEVMVPSRETRLATGFGILRDPAGSGNCRDYYLFFNDFTVELIEHFGKVVKQESGNRLLYGAFYGYFAHHLSAPPYHLLDSGHYAMTRLLRCRNVDTICSPYNYLGRDRNIGLGVPLASVKAAGKLFLAELDLPTHLANRNRYAADANKDSVFCHTPQDSVAYYWRDLARTITWGIGGYWLDFAHDWYRFPEFIELAGKTAAVNRLAATVDSRSVARVAVILDENSVYDLVLSAGNGYGRALYDNLGFSFDAGGAPWDCFLTSDLEKVVAGQYRLLVFANQLRQDDRIAGLLRNYRGSVLWLYATGAVRDNRLCRETDWCGFKLKYQPEGNSELKVGATVVKSPWLVAPGVTVEDPAATVMARFDGGAVGFASRQRPGGTNFFFALPYIDPSVLRKIYHQAGVHCYSSAGIPVYANASFIASFSRDGQGTTVTLPDKAEIVMDMWDGQVIGRNTVTIEIPARRKNQPNARLYFYGHAASVSNFSGNGSAAPAKKNR